MLQVKHLDQHHRIYIVLVALAVMITLMNGGMAILTEPTSWSYKVAHMTRPGSTIGYLFLVAAACMAPLVVSLARDRCTRKLFKLATAGSAMGALCCAGIAYMSRHLDLGWFSVYYFASGVLCLLVAGALSMVLNSSLAKFYHSSLTTRS